MSSLITGTTGTVSTPLLHCLATTGGRSARPVSVLARAALFFGELPADHLATATDALEAVYENLIENGSRPAPAESEASRQAQRERLTETEAARLPGRFGIGPVAAQPKSSMTPGRARSPTLDFRMRCHAIAAHSDRPSVATAFAASSLHLADRACAMDDEEQSQRVSKVCTQRHDS